MPTYRMGSVLCSLIIVLGATDGCKKATERKVVEVRAQQLSSEPGLGSCVPRQPAVAATLQGQPFDIAADGENIYWGNAGGGTINKMAKTGGDVTVVVAGRVDPFGIALDDDAIYWTERAGGVVMRVAKDGGEPEVLATEQPLPLFLAVDATSVYWTNGGLGDAQGDVRYIAKNGNGGVVTFAPQQRGPWAIAADGEHVFWTNRGDGTVWRANATTGEHAIALVRGQGEPFRLAVDDSGIYWVDNHTGQIATIGRMPGEAIVIGIDRPGLWGITLAGSNVYWTNFTTGTIGMVPKMGGTPCVLAKAFLPHEIASDGTRLYWTEMGSTYYGGIVAQTKLAATCIGRWSMDEGSGESVSDSCGDHPGALQGMGGGGWVAGKFSYGLAFDGLDDRMSVAGLPAVGGDMTMSLWFRATAQQAGEAELAALYGSTTPGGSYALDLVMREDGQVGFSGSGGPASTTLSGAVARDGQWHQMVVTRQNSTYTLYLDGIGRGKSGGTLVTYGSLTLGVGAAEARFNGELDDVRLYAEALSAVGVMQLYSGTGVALGGCSTSGAPSPAGTLCRVAAGPCDVAATCTGLSTECPANTMASPATVCRAPAGPCDLAEMCTGTSAACPVDKLALESTVCRVSTGPCDPAETCDGSGPACPPDVTNDQTPTACSGHGTCTGGACVCAPEYSGADCSVTCPGGPTCSGHGTCATAICACARGYTGASCSVDCATGFLCPNGTGCNINSDCASRVCGANHVCLAPGCTPHCNEGASCGANGDCGSGVCTSGLCQPPACSPLCSQGAACGLNGDCASRLCTNNLCQPPACSPRCNQGAACGVNGDCSSRVCTSGTCQAPACSPHCSQGAACGCNNDCSSQVCNTNGTCS